MRLYDEPLPPITFNVEHPFISIIRTANGLTLFGSVIMDPRIETKQNDPNNETASQQYPSKRLPKI